MKLLNSICVALAVGVLAGSNVSYAAEPNRGMDAGAQMERERRNIERERVLEQIAEDEATKNKKVEKEDAPSADEADTKISFELKQVVLDSSEVLTTDELKSVTDAYIGRQTTLKDLREMADRITGLYRDKGYMTCGAVLPPQRIHDGVVEIRLIEGKTGEISVG